MVPKITRGGGSFKGAFHYYLHDKGAETCNRVAWVQTENMRTSDPAKAWKVMAYTAKSQERLKEASGQSRAGRKLERPVFAFSLAWHPEQTPDRAHMLATARGAIAMLGLTEHEAVIVSHKDEPQKHVHVIVNRVHPMTGMAGDIRNSKRKFSDFAREYEQSQGKVYCARREENFKKRQNGEPTRYCDPHIQEAWSTTHSGRDFVAALAAKGYRLAHGRKRLVVIDPHGKTHNPVRNLRGVRTLEFMARLRDLDFDRIPDAGAAFSKVGVQTPEQTAERRPLDELARKQTEMKDQHRQAYDVAHLRHTQTVRTAKKTFVELYRLPDRKAGLARLKEKIEKAPWWRRLLGLTRKDRRLFSKQLMAYKHYITCYRAKIAEIEADGKQSLETLQKTQRKEQMSLKFQIDMRRAVGARVSPRHERMKDRLLTAPQKNRDHERTLGR